MYGVTCKRDGSETVVNPLCGLTAGTGGTQDNPIPVSGTGGSISVSTLEEEAPRARKRARLEDSFIRGRPNPNLRDQLLPATVAADAGVPHRYQDGETEEEDRKARGLGVHAVEYKMPHLRAEAQSHVPANPDAFGAPGTYQHQTIPYDVSNLAGDVAYGVASGIGQRVLSSTIGPMGSSALAMPFLAAGASAIKSAFTSDAHVSGE